MVLVKGEVFNESNLLKKENVEACTIIRTQVRNVVIVICNVLDQNASERSSGSRLSHIV